MTLPDNCPRDGASHCKKNACHLYVVDWRSGDEQCIIGYRSTHKNLSRSSPVVDSYAQDTRRRFGDRHGQEPLGSYPREKQAAEIRQVVAIQKNPGGVEVSVEKEQAANIPPMRILKEPDTSSRDEIKSWQRPDARSGSAQQEISEMREEVTVINTKNTTVIESREAPQEQASRKRKSLDDVMNLDLPDNYEEEFWK